MREKIKKNIPCKKRVKEKFKESVNISLGLSRIGRFYSYLKNTSGATILMYHSIESDANKGWVDPRNQISLRTFKSHLDFLRRYRNIVSIDEVIKAIQTNKTLSRGSVALTFDDGYLDNYTTAFPLLDKFGIPATIYLATGYIRREESQWVDQLYNCFSRRTNDTLNLCDLFMKEQILRNRQSTYDAYNRICLYLLSSTYNKRKEMLNRVNDQLRPSSISPRLTMNWKEAKSLVRKFPKITVGSHTADHLDVSSIGIDEVRNEINICTDEIKLEMKITPLHFSCPYSRTRAELPYILEDAGYLSSVTSNRDFLITKENSPYNLGRIAIPKSINHLAYLTSGAYPELTDTLYRGKKSGI